VAIGEAGNPQEALQALEQMDPAVTKQFQPWWVAKAYLLSLDSAASPAQVNAAYQTAIGLTVDKRLKSHLESVRQGQAPR
jgi:hypothetical protein